MKSQEELSALRVEYENVNKKLAELTEAELKEVVGGASGSVDSLRITSGEVFIDPDEINQKAAYEANYIKK